MTNKTKRVRKPKQNKTAGSTAQVAALSRELKKLKVKASTPFANVGSHLGNMVGFKDLGRGVGGFIGKILGSGDYRTNFDSVQSNQMMSASVPAFGADTVVTHREYIMDVTSSATAGSFNIQTGPLNPGQGYLFPWLSTVAGNYEEYEILGMIFEFKSMSGDYVGSSNTALGSVILATQYDPTKPTFVDKQQMENYEFAQSCKPSESVMHAVECKKVLTPVKSLYIRTTAQQTNQDLRWTDFGKFSVATVGFPGTSVNCGELWVSYKIALRKPRLTVTDTLGGSIAGFHAARATASTSNILGTTSLYVVGSITPSFTSTSSFTVQVNPQQYYLCVVSWEGGAATISGPGISLTGFNLVNAWNNATDNYVVAGNGAASTTLITSFLLESSGTAGPYNATVAFTGTVVLPSGNVDIWFTQVDSTISE